MSWFSRSARVAAAAAIAAASFAAVAPAASARSAATLSDIDGDGRADLVVGMPDYNNRGGVWIRYANGNTQTLTPPSSSFDNSRFGESVLVRDFNRDGYADIAVGARNFGGGNGLVMWFRGGPGGVDFNKVFDQWDGDAGSQLGTSLTYIESAPRPVLAVGAPGYTDGGTSDAGAVRLFSLRSDGTVNKMTWLTQDSPGVPGDSETGDYFGFSVASTGKALVVGAPNDSVGNVQRAGQVTLLVRTGELTFKGRTIHQNSKGVPDVAQQDDSFGYSVAAGLGMIVVGVPGESFGANTYAGAVQPFTYRGGTSVTPLSLRHQDSPGIPGSNAPGDRWGSSVAMVRPCVGKKGVVVGAPYKEVGGEAAAGAATLVTLGAGSRCPSRALQQGKTLGDAPESGDMAGWSVGVHRLSNSSRATDRIVVGIPGENDYRGRVTLVSPPYKSSASAKSYNGPTSFSWFGAGLNVPR